MTTLKKNVTYATSFKSGILKTFTLTGVEDTIPCLQNSVCKYNFTAQTDMTKRQHKGLKRS